LAMGDRETSERPPLSRPAGFNLGLVLLADLGENEAWLFDAANEMDVEDGVIWVYGDADDGVMAFTDFGIENLIDLIKIHKDDPTIIERWNASK
jgi:hypothetical protein